MIIKILALIVVLLALFSALVLAQTSEDEDLQQQVADNKQAITDLENSIPRPIDEGYLNRRLYFMTNTGYAALGVAIIALITALQNARKLRKLK